MTNELYYYGTGRRKNAVARVRLYPGGLRETSLGKMLDTHPDRVLQAAVKGMLPHNRLGRRLLGHLKVYGGPDHPHDAQVNAGSRSRKEPAASAVKEPA